MNKKENKNSYSLQVAAARKLTREEYLEDVLTRLPDMKTIEVAALTPAFWKRSKLPKLACPKAA